MSYLLLTYKDDVVIGINTGTYTLYSQDQVVYHLFKKGIPYMYYTLANHISETEILVSEIKEIKELPMWNDHDFCDYVVKHYRTILYVRNPDVSLIIPEQEYEPRSPHVPIPKEYHYDLWERYLSIVPKEIGMRDHVFFLYQHFSCEEVICLYKHYHKVYTNIFNKFGATPYAQIKDYLNANGILYRDEWDYTSSFAHDPPDEFWDLIHNLTYSNQATIESILDGSLPIPCHNLENIWSQHMRYTSDHHLRFYVPLTDTEYDDYHIEHHIIDGVPHDIKKPYHIVTYERIIELRNFLW